MKLEFAHGAEAGPVVSAPEPTAALQPAAPLRLDLSRGDLSPTLLARMFAVSFGYLAVMGLAFRAGTGLGLVFTVLGLALVAGFGLPLVMARAGNCAGRAAAARVMTVPLLMLGWATFIAFLH